MSIDLDAAEVVRVHAPFVWRVLRYQGVRDTQLEDLSQEVFLVIVQSLKNFEARSSLQTWIYGVCRNVVLHARRKQARRPELLMDAPPEQGVAETQSQDATRRAALLALQAALASVTEPKRMAFVLFEIERMPMEDVARALDCTLSAAYSKLYAARAQIRKALERSGRAEVYRDIVEAL